MYANEYRNDYTLPDAFHALGLRLYGSRWTGNELRARAVEDPGPVLEARAPLEARAEELATQRNRVEEARLDAFSEEEVQRLNDELSNITDAFHETHAQLLKLGDPSDSVVRDHENWERHKVARNTLVQAFRRDELTLRDPLGFAVSVRLWRDRPEGFDFDLELSLIIWPRSENARQITSACIKEAEFETWLDTVTPLVAEELGKLSPEQRARPWFKEQVRKRDRQIKKFQLLEMAQHEFPGLSGKAFERLWNELATDSMKARGRRRERK